MCNVPEVIMCYHLDGIVQKYELIKTEDLPHMCENQFSPTLVRDVAQNILAFLNTRATKEGHTYWLFKGKLCIVFQCVCLSVWAREWKSSMFFFLIQCLFLFFFLFSISQLTLLGWVCLVCLSVCVSMGWNCGVFFLILLYILVINLDWYFIYCCSLFGKDSNLVALCEM